MVWFFIISAILFTAGNIWWGVFNDPRFFYVPLALLLLSGSILVKNPTRRKCTWVQELLLEWNVVLALGNLVKQILYYSPTIKQINDYWWGAIITTLYLYKILRKWAIQNKRNGGRA